MSRTKGRDAMRSAVLRVWLLGDSPAANQIVGGEQVRPFELIEYWKRHHHEAEVWCLRPGPHSGASSAEVRVRRVRARGFVREVVVYPTALAAIVRAALAWRLGRRPRPVLFHRPGGLYWWHKLPIVGDVAIALLPLCRLLRIPVVATIHDISPEHEVHAMKRRQAANWEHDYYANVARMRRTARWNERLQRFGVRHSDIAVITSSTHRTELVARGVVPRREFCLVPPGVDPAMFESLEPAARPTRRWRVGIPGSAFDSDLVTLEEALRLLPPSHEFEIHLAGRDADVASAMRVPAHVHFRQSPQTRYRQFAEIAAEIDVWLLVWGRDEYFKTTSPLRIPMCIASGRPVVSTELPELTVAGLNDLLVVAEPTASAIADTVMCVVNDPQAFITARTNAQTVLETCTWDERFAPLERALAELLRSEPRDSG